MFISKTTSSCSQQKTKFGPIRLYTDSGRDRANLHRGLIKVLARPMVAGVRIYLNRWLQCALRQLCRGWFW